MVSTLPRRRTPALGFISRSPLRGVVAGLVAALAMGVIPAGAQASGQTDESLSPAQASGAANPLTWADKAGDQVIAGEGVPKWVKKSARSKESDLTGVTLRTTAKDEIQAVFRLSALKKGRNETKGRAAQRGRYYRSWTARLLLIDDGFAFPFDFGYEESEQGRNNPLDKPRVFTQTEGGYWICKDGRASLQQEQKKVVVTLPYSCFPEEWFGNEFDAFAYTSTLVHGQDGYSLPFGADYSDAKTQFALPEYYPPAS